LTSGPSWRAFQHSTAATFTPSYRSGDERDAQFKFMGSGCTITGAADVELEEELKQMSLPLPGCNASSRDQGDALHFDQRAQRQLRHLDG
jgi:hypothetical protein